MNPLGSGVRRLLSAHTPATEGFIPQGMLQETRIFVPQETRNFSRDASMLSRRQTKKAEPTDAASTS